MINNKKPKISVIMSVYNGEQYLADAVDSILNQTFKDFEFIIVNDGSTDRTKEILEGFEDERIMVINQDNMGISKSKNRAIELSKGEYIAIIDADDISLPQRLEKQVNFLDKHKDIGLVGTAANSIDEDGSILCTIPIIEDNETIQETLLRKNCFVHSSVMFRREAFEKVGGYRSEFKSALDYDLLLRIAERYKVYNLKEILCKYRFNPDGVTFNKREQQNKFVILARYLAQERRAGRGENLEINKSRIVGKINEDFSKNTFISNLLAQWRKLYIMSKQYYAIGCIHLYKGDLKRARELFFRSLKYNLFHIKAYMCLFITLLPFNLVKYLKFLFKETAQYYRDLNRGWE